MSAIIYDGNKIQEIEISCLDVLVTDRCNLRCKYCFHTKSPDDMSGETFERAIRFLGPQMKSNCEFNFFGGEPLLREEFCLRWMHEIKRLRPKASLHIATNGTIFSPGLVEIAKVEKPHFLQISYDGVNQSSNRGEAAVVEANLLSYLKEVGRGKITVRLTFTHDTVKDLYENLVLVYDMGVRRFAHHATYDNAWTDWELGEYNRQLDKMHEFLDEHPDMENVFCDCKLAVRSRKIFRCAMGRSLIALAPDGRLFPCHYAVSVPRFQIGDVYAEVLNRGRFAGIGMAGCDSCSARNVCHNCLIANYVFTKSLTKPLKCTCSMNKYEYSKVKDKYEGMYEYTDSEGAILERMAEVISDVCSNNVKAIRELNETLID